MATCPHPRHRIGAVSLPSWSKRPRRILTGCAPPQPSQRIGPVHRLCRPFGEGDRSSSDNPQDPQVRIVVQSFRYLTRAASAQRGQHTQASSLSSTSTRPVSRWRRGDGRPVMFIPLSKMLYLSIENVARHVRGLLAQSSPEIFLSLLPQSLSHAGEPLPRHLARLLLFYRCRATSNRPAKRRKKGRPEWAGRPGYRPGLPGRRQRLDTMCRRVA